jgi:hypothetical protein
VSGEGGQGPPPLDDNVVWLSAEEARRREALKRGPKGLFLRQWLETKFPPNDYLIGEVLCTTSRWLLFGDTGIGKTLFAMMLAGAVASGDAFLNWPGTGQPRRVVYLDGEMPAEVMQERMKLVAAQYGEDIELVGFNRDVEDWPPLNDKRGVAWFTQVLQAYRPHLVVFDSIMALVGGVMMEEESWQPMRTFVRWLSAKHVAQIWLHHTGHDGSHSYGTKTREWEMDSVLALRRVDQEADGANEPAARAEMEFTKARLRTPKTWAQFKAATIVFDGDEERTQWRVDAAAPPVVPAAKAKAGSAERARGDDLVARLSRAYADLAHEVPDSQDFDGAIVRKVSVHALRYQLRRHGWLDHEGGALTAAARKRFERAKEALLKSGNFTELDGEIWRVGS